MNDERNEFRVEPVGTSGAGRAVPIAAFVVGILLGAAVVKPWDLVFPARAELSGPSANSTAAANARGSAVVSPSSAPSPATPAECAFAGGWRVFALGKRDRLGGDGSAASEPAVTDDAGEIGDIGNPLRRWLEVQPLTRASGPDDPRIPFVTIVSDRISGIGYCPPPNGADGPPTGATLAAWSLDSSAAASQVPLRPVRAISIEVDVFVGADRPGDRASWPAGRFVFVVGGLDGSAYARWFGVEIRTPPGPEPSSP